MGMWANHRARQAGKYAKRTWQLEMERERRAQAEAAHLAQVARDAALDWEWFEFGRFTCREHHAGRPIPPAPVGRAYAHYARGWEVAAHEVAALTPTPLAPAEVA